MFRCITKAMHLENLEQPAIWNGGNGGSTRLFA
jgi:hypothetical protein